MKESEWAFMTVLPALMLVLEEIALMLEWTAEEFPKENEEVFATYPNPKDLACEFIDEQVLVVFGAFMLEEIENEDF